MGTVLFFFLYKRAFVSNWFKRRPKETGLLLFFLIWVQTFHCGVSHL